MFEPPSKNEREENALPFGQTLRPLLSSSNLSDSDLKFILQKRGIFTKDQKRKNTTPKLCSILLSPKEFDTLRNRQSLRESSIKTSSATSLVEQ